MLFRHFAIFQLFLLTPVFTTQAASLTVEAREVLRRAVIRGAVEGAYRRDTLKVHRELLKSYGQLGLLPNQVHRISREKWQDHYLPGVLGVSQLGFLGQPSVGLGYEQLAIINQGGLVRAVVPYSDVRDRWKLVSNFIAGLSGFDPTGQHISTLDRLGVTYSNGVILDLTLGTAEERSLARSLLRISLEEGVHAFCHGLQPGQAVGSLGALDYQVYLHQTGQKFDEESLVFSFFRMAGIGMEEFEIDRPRHDPSGIPGLQHFGRRAFFDWIQQNPWPDYLRSSVTLGPGSRVIGGSRVVRHGLPAGPNNPWTKIGDFLLQMRRAGD